MSVTAPTPITALGTPPSTSDPVNFDTRGDALLTQLPTTVTEMNALGTVTYNNAVDCYNNATAAAASEASAAANAALASAAAGATLWVSGTTYAIGDRRYSPLNGLTYRRLTVGAGTTDPSADATNWAALVLSPPAVLVTSPAVSAVNGQFIALTNSTAQAAATNLLLYSEQFNNAAWSKIRSTAWDSPSVASPSDAPVSHPDKLVEDTTASSTHYCVQAATVFGATQYSFSVFLKVGERSKANVLIDGGVGDYSNAVVNLVSGAVISGGANGSFTGYSSSCSYFGNGWWRVHIASTTAAGTTSLQCQVRIHNGTNDTYTGDGGGGLFIWGAQLETGPTATSYIPTTSATATRPSGVVAPQRVVLPASLSSDAWVRVKVCNGVSTNVIDPDGGTIEGVSGPMLLDDPYACIALQKINSSWRIL